MLTALAMVAAGAPTIAAADPVYPSAGQIKDAKAAAGTKAAQIVVIEGQLKASNAHLAKVRTAAEAAAEAYNLARVLLAERTEAAQSAERRATAAQQVAAAALDKLGQFAAATYRQGGALDELAVVLSAKGPQEVLDRVAGVKLVGDIRSRIKREAEAASAAAGVLRAQAAQALAQQEAAAKVSEAAGVKAQAQVDLVSAQSAAIAKAQAAMIVQLAALRATSVTLETRRQSGLLAEAAAAAAAAAAQARAAAAAAARARSAAAAAAAAVARAADRRVPTPDPAPPVRPVASHGGVAAVIAFAKAQLGMPYQWGGAGPDMWDCSGLTQGAWSRAGVNLAHYTGFQWAETTRIPLADLQPGDLVFYGDSGSSSHHVGLYMGNDMMINAPHTGSFVRYDNIYEFGTDLLPYGGRP